MTLLLLVAALSAADRPAAPPPDRAALQRLLEEPEFSRVRNRNANVIAVLWEQLFAWLKRLFQTRGAATFAKAAPFFVLTVAFTIALLALLRFVRFRPREATAVSRPEPERLDLRPPPEHLANARRLAASEPRAAIREALLALLSSLERKNLARPDRVKTNRELCAELPGRGADAALVGAVRSRIDWYDRTYYSLAPVSSEDARTFVSEIEGLAR